MIWQPLDAGPSRQHGPIEFVYELNGGHYRIGPSATVSGDRRAGGFEELSAQSASDEARRRPAESIPVARDVVADRDTFEHRLADGLRFSVSPAVPGCVRGFAA